MIRRIQDLLRKADRFLMAIVSRFRPKLKPELGKLLVVESRIGADDLARNGKFVVVAPGGHQKWALFMCPCGCGEVVALNLMQSQRPCWRLESANGSYSLAPSVDSQTCGSHYWVKDGRINWC